MADTPVYEAETVLTTAIYQALSSLAPSGGLHWKIAVNSPMLPYAIFQPQTAIDAVRFVGRLEAECDIAVKAIAASASQARALLTAMVPGMSSLVYSGYTLTTEYRNTPQVPPLDGVWQSIHVWTVRISQN